MQPRRAPLLRRAPALLLQAPPPLLLVLRPAAAQHRAAHTHPSGGLNRTRTRLRRLIGHELRREVRQDKLLRRLQALWDRRPPEERAAFLHSLATEFGTSDEDAAAALHLVEEGAGAAGAERAAALLEARRLLAPEYEQLAAGLAERPAGLRLLLDLRSATLKLLRQRDTAPAAAAALRPFEASLQAQLRAWFSPGLLALERVSWQRTPPPLLERVIAAEAVHSITSWCEKRLFLSHLYTKNHLFTKTDSGQTWKKAEGKGIVRRDDLKVRKRHFARDFLLNTIVFPPRQARDPINIGKALKKRVAFSYSNASGTTGASGSSHTQRSPPSRWQCSRLLSLRALPRRWPGSCGKTRGKRRLPVRRWMSGGVAALLVVVAGGQKVTAAQRCVQSFIRSRRPSLDWAGLILGRC